MDGSTPWNMSTRIWPWDWWQSMIFSKLVEAASGSGVGFGENDDRDLRAFYRSRKLLQRRFLEQILVVEESVDGGVREGAVDEDVVDH